MKRGFVLGGWWPFPGWLARPWERSEREELGTACPALALLPWAFTWLIPIPQQPQRSQELPIAQEMKGVLWEDLGIAGTQPGAAVGTSSPPAPLAFPECVFV